MIWNVFKYQVLGLVLLMYCLPSDKSEKCKETEVIVGRLGEELEVKFPFANLGEKHYKHKAEKYGEEIVQNGIRIQDQHRHLIIRFRNKIESVIHDKIYMDGNKTKLADNRTEFFMTNDAFVVKKTKLQREDAGIYLIDLGSIRLGQKILIISGKSTVKEGSSQNPVLKPENNYTSTIQLECHSVSTSIGACPLSMYTVWYRNEMRLTDVDPTLSQINVTVDHNGGIFICLATDYPPCYQRLQTKKRYDEDIDECNHVSGSETFKVLPEFPPIDVKLKPDKKQITANKTKDLKVRCSAKCHPMCDVTWENEFGSNLRKNILENRFENNLKIENINSSNEGVYVCLVKNIHGEVKKNFTLRVKETENNKQNGDVHVYLIVLTIVLVIIFVIGLVFVVFRQGKKILDRLKKRVPMLTEETKISESLENVESMKIEEDKKMLESLEKRISIMTEEDKKMLKSLEKRISMLTGDKKKIIENMMENDLKKMEGEKKKMIEKLELNTLKMIKGKQKGSLEKRIPRQTGETEMSECLERRIPMLTEEGKKMLDRLKKRISMLTEEDKKMLESLENVESMKIEDNKKIMIIEENELKMMEGKKKKMIEKLELNTLKMIKGNLTKIMDSFEQEELMKIKEYKKILDRLKKRVPMLTEEEKKMLESLEKRIPMLTGDKKIIEIIEENELKKMEEDKKMLDRLKKRISMLTEETKMSEILEKKELMKIEDERTNLHQNASTPLLQSQDESNYSLNNNRRKSKNWL